MILELIRLHLKDGAPSFSKVIRKGASATHDIMCVLFVCFASHPRWKQTNDEHKQAGHEDDDGGEEVLCFGLYFL